MASIWLEDKINFIIFIEDMMLNEGLFLFEMNADHPPPCLACVCVGGGEGLQSFVGVKFLPQGLSSCGGPAGALYCLL